MVRQLRMGRVVASSKPIVKDIFTLFQLIAMQECEPSVIRSSHFSKESKSLDFRCAWLAQLVEPETLDHGVVSSSPK